jgi:hypothetical protein
MERQGEGLLKQGMVGISICYCYGYEHFAWLCLARFHFSHYRSCHPYWCGLVDDEKLYAKQKRYDL